MKPSAATSLVRGRRSVQSKETDVVAYRKLLRTQNPEVREKEGFEKALRLFHEAALRVPAYKDFLKKNRVRHQSIRSSKDFASLPITTKKNYIQEYPLHLRSWDGKLTNNSLLAMSSGTTGAPTLWPRGGEQEAEAIFVHEFLFQELFDIDKVRTL